MKPVSLILMFEASMSSVIPYESVYHLRSNSQRTLSATNKRPPPNRILKMFKKNI